ncbi:MAG: uracil-DNA glycosylase [Chloroflexi bacterium]|nr:MAG: uracil-DNA glycosylase [Chloroflexota bacterium]
MDQTPESGVLSNEEGRVQTLLGLEKEICACMLCRLCDGRICAVPGEGSFSPQIVFVGEGPGAQEDRLGRPFVGRSGRFLDGMIDGIGLRREDVFITNVVKCRPPDNRDPRPDEIAACRDYLDRQIELLAPRVVVTLGRFSMERWFPGERITRIHGQVKEIGSGRVALAMYHPAAALRNPQWRNAFAADMQKLPGLLMSQ